MADCALPRATTFERVRNDPLEKGLAAARRGNFGSLSGRFFCGLLRGCLFAAFGGFNVPRKEGVVLADGFEEAFVGEFGVGHLGDDKADDDGGDGEKLLFAGGLGAPPTGDGLGEVFLQIALGFLNGLGEDGFDFGLEFGRHDVLGRPFQIFDGQPLPLF